MLCFVTHLCSSPPFSVRFWGCVDRKLETCHQEHGGPCETSEFQMTHMSRFLAPNPFNCSPRLSTCLSRKLSTPGSGEDLCLFLAVKTEAASGDCPLQGLLNCLKEIPAARDTRLSHSGSGDPQLQEDPGAQKRNSGGKGLWLRREGPGHHPFFPPLQAGLWVPLHSKTLRPCVGVSVGVARCRGSSLEMELVVQEVRHHPR